MDDESGGGEGDQRREEEAASQHRHDELLGSRQAPRPLARRMLHAITGPFIRHGGDAANDPNHCRVWCHVYPSDCALNVIELFVTVEVGVDCKSLQVPVLAFANPNDKTINFKATEANVRSMPASTLEVVTDSENCHVLTGRIKSPSTVPRVTNRIQSFLKMVSKRF